MYRWMRTPVTITTALLLSAPLFAGAESIPSRASEPYLGAIVVDATTGNVLVEDNADEKGYPASVIKLMDLLLVLEFVESGALSLDDEVQVTAEAARMGGSQVYLAEKEVFTVDDLLYALVVQSANDAAVALAIHIAGSKDAFAELMNEKAAELGMDSTEIHSVHGLPPGKNQKPDITTARDLAVLCRELVKHPDVFKYTATREKGFRDGKFIMRTHNPLLGSFSGCDGLKTGYFRKAGFSIAATAERKGNRIIAVVLDSKQKKVRNQKAAELLSKGFLELAKGKRAEGEK